MFSILFLIRGDLIRNQGFSHTIGGGQGWGGPPPVIQDGKELKKPPANRYFNEN